MKKFSMWFMLGLVLVVVASHVDAAQQQNPPAPAPAPAQQAQSFEGALVKVDVDAHMLTAKAADNKEWQFRYTDQTEVVGPEKTIQGLAGKPGAKLKIMYRAERGANLATRIELSPGT